MQLSRGIQSTDRVFQVEELGAGAVEEIGRHPADFLVAGLASLAVRAAGAVADGGQAVQRAIEPDARFEGARTGVVDDLAAVESHFGEAVGALVASAADHSRPTLALTWTGIIRRLNQY